MDIAAWLRSLGLGRYEQAFLDNAVDTDVLLKLTGHDFKEIGVLAVGDRGTLLEAVAALQHGSAARASDGEAEALAGYTWAISQSMLILATQALAHTPQWSLE